MTENRIYIITQCYYFCSTNKELMGPDLSYNFLPFGINQQNSSRKPKRTVGMQVFGAIKNMSEVMKEA